MKVLFATTVFENVQNGPGAYAQYLWQAFRDDEDIDFHLVAPEGPAIHSNLHYSGKPAGSLALYNAVREETKRILAGGDFDILHTNSAHMVGAMDVPVPMLVQINDYEVANAFIDPCQTIREKGLKRSMSLAWRKVNELGAIRNAYSVICNSHYVQRALTDTYDVDESRFEVIYKAVDLDLFERPADFVVDKAFISPGTVQMVLIGSNWHIKGLDLLLQALELLVKENAAVKLVVIGAEELPNNTSIRNRFVHLERSGHITYTGRQERSEVARWLWHSDICVLASREEALGVSVLEAMAAGTAVVASDTGGIPEIISDEKFGSLFPSGDSHSLYRTLKQVVDSEPLRRSLVEHGRQRAAEFSRQKMIACVKRCYARVLAEQHD